MRRSLLIGEGFEGVRIIGSRFSPDAHRLRDFATRNAFPSPARSRIGRAGRRDAATVRRASVGDADRDRPRTASGTAIRRSRSSRLHRAHGTRSRRITSTISSWWVRGRRGSPHPYMRASEGLERAHTRLARGRWSGGNEQSHRELSRLSRWHLGRGISRRTRCFRRSDSVRASRCRVRCVAGHQWRRACRHARRWHAHSYTLRARLERGAISRARRAARIATSTAPGSTMPRPRWRRVSARAKRSSWSVPETPPDRRSSTSRDTRGRCTCVRGDDLGASMSRYLVERSEHSKRT